MHHHLANGCVYRELLHSVREAMIAWYCRVLTKSMNCTLQSSSCRFPSSRAFKNSIVRIIPINGRSPKAVVSTVVPTTSFHVHHPKSIVQAAPINRQPAKTIFRTILIDRQSPRSFVWTVPINWKPQTSIVQAIPINRLPVTTILWIIPTNRQSPRSFVWTIPTNWKPQTWIVQAIQLIDTLWKQFSGQSQLIGSVRDHLSRQFQLIESTRPQKFSQF